VTPLPALPEQTPKHAKTPRHPARGFLTSRTPEIFSPFRSTGGAQTLSAPKLHTCSLRGIFFRRSGGKTLQGFPALRTPEIFSPFRSTGDAQTPPSPLRRQDSARLSGATDTGDFSPFRSTGGAAQTASENVHGSELPCTFSICVCPRLRRGRRVPGSGCAAARGRGPGAGCRRHSPGRGSAAGCAGRRLRRP